MGITAERNTPLWPNQIYAARLWTHNLRVTSLMYDAVIYPAGCVVMSDSGSTVYSVHKWSKSGHDETTGHPCMHVFTHAHVFMYLAVKGQRVKGIENA